MSRTAKILKADIEGLQLCDLLEYLHSEFSFYINIPIKVIREPLHYVFEQDTIQ